MRSVLVLGGTAEARELASTLDARESVRVISSLAGRVARPRLPEGEVRIGGFGGPERLAEWLREERIDDVVDATHPFAERISASAAWAASVTGVPLLRLERPGWTEGPGDAWRWADTLEGAAAVVADLAGRTFLTTGRQGLEAFAPLAGIWFLIRCVDPPEGAMPPRHELILDRGPYTLEGELELFRSRDIEVLVTKDSGGEHTRPKLDAARQVGAAVVIVRRPSRPDAPVANTVAEALAWLERVQPG